MFTTKCCCFRSRAEESDINGPRIAVLQNNQERLQGQDRCSDSTDTSDTCNNEQKEVLPVTFPKRGRRTNSIYRFSMHTGNLLIVNTSGARRRSPGHMTCDLYNRSMRNRNMCYCVFLHKCFCCLGSTLGFIITRSTIYEESPQSNRQLKRV